MKKFLIIVVVIVVAGIVGINLWVESVRNKGVEENYNAGISLIKEGKYQEANLKLCHFIPNGVSMPSDSNYRNFKYADKAKALAYYASAQRLLQENNISLAAYSLHQIPDNYNGEFAKEIKQLKDQVFENENKLIQAKIKSDEDRKKEREKERASKIYIGDSEYKVLELWGEPQRKNRTVTGNGVHEQWVYGNKYIYIDNGTVTAFQD